jgi:predicted PurR-regulated permease PerM
MKPAKIEISHKTITFTVFFLLSLAFLYQIRSILLLLFIAIIFMSALSPVVDRLEKLKLPRSLSILLLYIIIWSVVSFGIASLVPPLVEQSAVFISSLPQDVTQLTGGKFDLSIFQPQLSALPEKILRLAVGAFNNIITLFTFMVIVYYLIIERKNLKKYLTFLFGDGDREKHAEVFINKLEHKLGSWMRGQLALMIIVGLMSYIGLTFLGVEFAVPLAFLAGLFEIIPNVGPTISMIPAVLVALGSSPILGLAVFALYLIIQQLENNLIVPKVMSKAVGLSPLVIIVALLTGFKAAGAAGAVLAVPTLLLIEIFTKDLYHRHYRKK